MVDVDGATLEVFTGGDGEPTLCFTHNFDVLTAEGALAMPALARVSRTIGVNQRSMGNSSAESDPSRLSMGQAVTDLEAIRRALGIESWVYVGYSAGGFIGIRYALEHPGALSGLILMATAPSYRVFLDRASVYCRHNPNYERVQTAMGTQDWGEVVWPLIAHDLESVTHHASHTGGISQARQDAQIAQMRSYDFEERLSDVRVPTLVLHGRHDASMPLSQGELIASKIPECRLIILEKSGHFPMWEEPKELERQVHAFVAGLGATGQ
jgi:pimeloyl-ACP methyl ester carboxylesterase